MAEVKHRSPTLTTTTLQEVAPQPDPAIRERLFQQISGPERYVPFAPDVARTFSVSEKQALHALRAIHSDVGWFPGPFPGSRVMVTEHGIIVASLPVGTHIPKHTHAERELTLVLDGELSTPGEPGFGPGSVLDMPVDSCHELRVTSDHVCFAVFGLVRSSAG